MKKVLIVLCSVLLMFLVACDNGQIYAEQPTYSYYAAGNYDYSENGDYEGNNVEEIILTSNAHPFAAILIEMMSDVPYYVTEFLDEVGHYNKIDAFLVDIDGNGTLGMLVRSWERQITGNLFRIGTLFYLQEDEIRYRAMGQQVSGFLNATLVEDNRLVTILRDGGHHGSALLTIENGNVVEYVNIFRELVDVVDGVSNFAYYINGEPATQEEFSELHVRYGFDNIHFRTEEEIQTETQYILSMIIE